MTTAQIAASSSFSSAPIPIPRRAAGYPHQRRRRSSGDVLPVLRGHHHRGDPGRGRGATTDTETLCGAIAAYLLIGMFLAFAYKAASEFDSVPFFGSAGDGSVSQYLFFSFVNGMRSRRSPCRGCQLCPAR